MTGNINATRAVPMGDVSRLMVCVDGSNSGLVFGRVFSPYFHTELPFSSLDEFLRLSCFHFDAAAYPRSVFDLRSFKSPRRQTKLRTEAKRMMTTKPVSEEQVSHGDKGTFMVKVLFRQSATWQGTVNWVEGGKSQNFRSMLELIHLIEDALGTDQVSWDTDQK